VSLAQSDPGGRPLLGVKDYIEVICERLEWLLVSRLPELLSLDDAMLLANGERAISEDRATLLDWTRFLKALLRERIAVALPRGLTGVFLRVEEQGLDHFERVERSRGHPQVLPLLWGRQPTALTLTLSHAAEDRLTRRLDGGWRLECSVSESNRILRELREIAEEGFTVRLVVRDSRHRQALAAFLYSRRVPMPVLTVAEVADWMDLGETRALELAGLAR
jgi:flagellar biosynthesis component FlhA